MEIVLELVDRKVFFIEDNHWRGQGCPSSEMPSEEVLMLLALVALDETDSTGLEREVLLLLLLLLDVPWLAIAGGQLLALAELAGEAPLLPWTDALTSTALGEFRFGV